MNKDLLLKLTKKVWFSTGERAKQKGKKRHAHARKEEKVQRNKKVGKEG